MEGNKRVDELMLPVLNAINRHVKDRDAKTDIYNRAYEALLISMEEIAALREQVRPVYVVTMYRYGDREKHSYVYGVFSDKDLARRSGYDEEFQRGGKYKAEVTSWIINEPKEFTEKETE